MSRPRPPLPTLNWEEVRAAVHCSGASRVPRLLHWYNARTLQTHGRLLDDLRRKYPDDIVVVWPPTWSWGAVHRQGAGGSYTVHHPLADWKAWRAWEREHFPDLRHPADFSAVAQVRRERPEAYVMGAWPLGIFERMHSLRPMDLVLIDLLEADQRLLRLGEMLTELYIRVVELLAAAGAHAFRFTDDWGMQHRMIIRPELWRDIFKPWYAAIFARCHELGLDVLFHSCGYIQPILADLLETGVHIFHPIQPRAMDAEAAAAKLRGRAAVAGGIDVQDTLVYGSPADVAEQMRRWRDLFWQDGGFIFWPTNTIMPETPVENLVAMCRASEALRVAG